MGEFSPTRHNGDCEEIANPSTAYGRRRRNWIDAHGSVPPGQVVDASCGNGHCIALKHAYLRPRVEQPGKYRKIADRVHRLKKNAKGEGDTESDTLVRAAVNNVEALAFDDAEVYVAKEIKFLAVSYPVLFSAYETAVTMALTTRSDEDNAKADKAKQALDKTERCIAEWRATLHNLSSERPKQCE